LGYRVLWDLILFLLFLVRKYIKEKKHFCIRIFSLSVIPFFLPIINFGFLYQYDLGKRELQRVINENHK
jgi:dolichyl-phosphate-mannose--protein O-mannosyl transferase